MHAPNQYSIVFEYRKGYWLLGRASFAMLEELCSVASIVGDPSDTPKKEIDIGSSPE